MDTTDMPGLFDTLKTGAMELAKSIFADVSEAKQDSQDMLDQMKPDIERWSAKVAAGVLSPDDLRYLVEGRKNLMQMKALEKKGVAKIEINKFKNGMVDVLVNTICQII